MRRPAGRFGEDDESALDKPGKEKSAPISPQKKSSLLPLEFSIYKYQAPISGVTYVEANYDDSNYGGGGDDENSVSRMAEEGDWDGILLKASARKVSIGDVQVGSDQHQHHPSRTQSMLNRPEDIPESPTAPESTTTATPSDIVESVTAPPEAPESEDQPSSAKPKKKKKPKKAGAGTGKKRKKKAAIPGESLSSSETKKKGTKKKKKKKKTTEGAKSDENKVPKKTAPAPPPPSRETKVEHDYDEDDYGIDWDYSVVDGIEHSDTPVTTNSKHANAVRSETLANANVAARLKPKMPIDPYRATTSEESDAASEPKESDTRQRDRKAPKKSPSNLLSKLFQKSGMKNLRGSFSAGDKKDLKKQ